MEEEKGGGGGAVDLTTTHKIDLPFHELHHSSNPHLTCWISH